MTEDELRTEFEAWLNSLSVKPDLRMNGQLYRNIAVQGRWIGWRACYSKYVKPLV